MFNTAESDSDIVMVSWSDQYFNSLHSFDLKFNLKSDSRSPLSQIVNFWNKYWIINWAIFKLQLSNSTFLILLYDTTF